ncbi:MAG TPA: fatty acid desaturase [Thermoleophilaceae bacterium]
MPETDHQMSTADRLYTLIGVFLPFAGFVTAIALLWNRGVGWSDLAVLLLMYVLTGLGVTVGFHRLLTHRAFDSPRPVRYTFAVLGSMALQGSVIDWVSDHRKHHAFADEEGDPHSPHGHGPGALGVLKGLWHSHMGWLFETQGTADHNRYARDLMEDRGMRWIHRRFPLLAAATLALPASLGYLLTGTAAGALTGFIWGGLVRVFLLHHVTWSINSVCHFAGRRRFATDDHSTNVFWLALPSFGESWHHNHHAFPRSARHGLRWWELDPSALVIVAMKRVGLARSVVEISPSRQEERRAGAAI